MHHIPGNIEAAGRAGRELRAIISIAQNLARDNVPEYQVHQRRTGDGTAREWFLICTALLLRLGRIEPLQLDANTVNHQNIPAKDQRDTLYLRPHGRRKKDEEYNNAENRFHAARITAPRVNRTSRFGDGIVIAPVQSSPRPPARTYSLPKLPRETIWA